MPDQVTSSSLNPPSQPPLSPKQLPDRPNEGFKLLFLGGIIIAFFVIILSLIFMKNSWRKSPVSTQMYTNIKPTGTSQPNKPGWNIYESTGFGYTFEYPNDYRIEIGETGTHLLEKVSVFTTIYQYPLFKVTVWNYPGSALQRQDIENWCFRTLLEEARKENLLCAFMSSAAIDEIEIDNNLAFTVSSYSSFGEKVAYYIIPQTGKVIIVQSVTLLNDQSLDNGKSKAKEILQTFSMQ